MGGSRPPFAASASPSDPPPNPVLVGSVWLPAFSRLYLAFDPPIVDGDIDDLTPWVYQMPDGDLPPLQITITPSSMQFELDPAGGGEPYLVDYVPGVTPYVTAAGGVLQELHHSLPV